MASVCCEICHAMKCVIKCRDSRICGSARHEERSIMIACGKCYYDLIVKGEVL